MRQGDHHVFLGDQVFNIDIGRVQDDLGLARIACLLADGAQFGIDDRGDAGRLGQDVEQISDLIHDFPVLADNLVLLHIGQALQLHFQNALRLHIGEAIALGRKTKFRRQVFRAVAVGHGTGEHFLDQRRTPNPRHQLLLGVSRRRSRLDEGNDLVDIGERNRQTFQDVATFAGFAQFKDSTACHHLAPVCQEAFEHLLEIEQTRLAINQRHHVHAEGVLQLRELEQIVQHHLRHFATLEFDDDAHAGFVRLVAQVRNPFDALFLHQLGNLFEQGFLVNLIRDLVDDDRLAMALLHVFKVCTRTHDHTAAPGAITLMHAGKAIDQGCRGEIRRRNDLDQILNVCLGIGEQRQAAFDNLGEIVRRNIRRHPHRDTG